MRRFLFFTMFILCLVLGYGINRAGHLRDVYQSICNLTEENFYRDDFHLDDWLRECHQRAAQLPLFARPKILLNDVQDLMNSMGVSHFQIYSPVEDRQLWKGEAIDTGIRSRYVEDHLVVYRVLPESAGALADVRAGDEILKLPGSDQVTPWGAQNRSGLFTLRRGARELSVTLASHTMTPNYAPQIIPLGHNTALVEIPSFRSDFFEAESWRQFAKKFAQYSHIILDVRENSGGNFVAMLRALSPFTCGRQLIGKLLQPRKDLPARQAFDDNIEDRFQIAQLDQFSSLGLQTFTDYGCYRGRVTVLISSDTASVAEIFADYFLHLKQARVWGQPSAGDVVLAVWYDLPKLGEGYSLSIPEATYTNARGVQLEGGGVWPQRELFYDLKTALEGKDSWVQQALR